MIKGSLLVLLGAMSFGFLSTVVKIATKQGLSIMLICLGQSLGGMICLWLIFYISRNRKNETKGFDNAQIQMLLCGATIGLTTVLYYKAVTLIPVSVAIVILMNFIWVGILFEVLLFRKYPSKIEIIASLIILIGSYLGSGASFSSLPQLNLKGLAFAFGSTVMYALYFLSNSRIKSSVPVLKKGALIMTGSSLVTLFVSLSFFTNHVVYFSNSYIIWFVLLIVFGTIIPPLCFAAGTPKVGVVWSSILASVELPVAILCGVIVLQESFSIIQLIGVVLLLTAIIYLRLATLRFKTFKSLESSGSASDNFYF